MLRRRLRRNLLFLRYIHDIRSPRLKQRKRPRQKRQKCARGEFLCNFSHRLILSRPGEKIFTQLFFNFLKIFCQRTDPNFNTLLRSGGGAFHPRRPGERTITNEKEETTTTTTTTTTPARERFLSRAVSPSTPRSAKTLESATLCAVDNERRRTSDRSRAPFLCSTKRL